MPQINLKHAVDHLADHDPVLAPIIAATAGQPDFVAHNDYYGALVGEIIGQQLSTKAAAAIRQRFIDLFGGTMPDPAAMLQMPAEELRAVGLSWAKAKYIHDLAQHVIDGKVHFDQLDQQTNQEIITELTDVKGIGEWTAHMFLMFCMGRLDVLPTGDLGIRNGIRALYGLAEAPTPDQIRDLAANNHWHPYESVASWYIWESLDNKPAV